MRPATWNGRRPSCPKGSESPQRLAAGGAGPDPRAAGGNPSPSRRLDAEALTECEAAAATLESEGDVEGLAEAWLAIGSMRFFLGDEPAGEEALERAAACARQSGNHRASRQARGWLVVTFHVLPIPADVAIGRAEQILEAASGDSWAEAAILGPLSVLYAYAGRFADARAAIARSQSIFTGSGARLERRLRDLDGRDRDDRREPPRPKRELRKGCEALRAMGDRGYRRASSRLAEAVYAQGRLDEAQQLTEEAEAIAAADDLDAQARWRAIGRRCSRDAASSPPPGS